jgi:hypothetical protein
MLTGQNARMLPLIAVPQSMFRTAIVCTVLCGALAAVPARAQLGSIFGDTPPRPPANVPNGSLPPQPPPVQYPGRAPVAAPPQQYPAQSAFPPPPSIPSPSGIQSQPLPPPPGAVMAPAATVNRTIVPQTGAPVAAQGQPPAPQQAPPQTDDSVVIEMPTQKIENSRAVFAGLDKITGRIISFDAAVGETVQFGALRVIARACYTRPPTEATNTDAFVQVDEVTLQGEVKRIFSGWMFAASPGLHAVEHPIYDVWLTDCASPLKVAEPAAPPPATPTNTRTPGSSRTRQSAAPRQQPGASPPPPVQAQPQ